MPLNQLNKQTKFAGNHNTQDRWRIFVANGAHLQMLCVLQNAVRRSYKRSDLESVTEHHASTHRSNS